MKQNRSQKVLSPKPARILSSGKRVLHRTSSLHAVYGNILNYFERETIPVELHIVDSSEMKRLNKRYRGSNRPTDILSFQTTQPGLLGSLIVDHETAKLQAKEFGHSFEREMKELFIHGVLHLLGFDHESRPEAELMSRYELFFGGRSC